MIRATPGFAPGYILVGPKSGTPDDVVQQTLADHGGRSLGKLDKLNIHVVEVPVDREVDTVERLAKNPHVRFAEVDRVMPPTATANDPMFGSEWHLAKIGAPAAWDTSTGSGVTVAILDSGVDGTHPDLSAKMVPGWNFYDSNSNTSDVYGHGTIVAGAAAAATNNSTGVASVAGGAKIMPMRVTDTSGIAYASSLSQALTWAADHGARVASISFQGVAASATVQSAASYFRSKGGVVIVAAGNTGTQDSTAPSDLMTVVSGTDSNDVIASWSTYGSFVDIAAPGVNIYSTVRGGGYGAYSGTSMATPLVAGTAALILARRPDFAPAQVASTLYSSATDVGAVGTDIYYGHGRVNAAAALALAAGAATDTTKPSAAITSPTGGTVSGLVNVTVNATDNVGVTRVDLRANGQAVASDTLAPFQFTWDSTKVPNGTATLTAVAYDAAGNAGTSAGVSVNVSNGAPPPADTTPPTIHITAPGSGAKVTGLVTISTSAADNSGATGITQLLYVDGALVASGNGSSMSYKWNTRKAKAGPHTISATARDAAGNSASAQEQVTK
jgi:subtilisin family serine protease